MGALLQDLRYAFRVLVKSRGFTAAALVVLALGIGANSAIFGVVNAVLLRPMPFADPNGLVEVFHVPPPQSFPGIKEFSVSPANYLDWRALNKSFDGMAAYTLRQATLTGLDRPEVVHAAWAGGDFFSILRTQAQLGRIFTQDDDAPGRGKVAVISHGFWESHFGASPSALGRNLMINGETYSIIGVAPAQLHFPAWAPTAADVWMPLAWNADVRAVRNNHNFLVAARLKPGVPMSQAQAEMNTISSQLANQYPDADRDWGAVVVSLREELVGNVRPVLLVLLGAVAFVLLIACANVANLITARNLARQKEIALRAALGASRGRAMQQFLCEAMVLSVAGGLLGLALANAATPLLAVFVSQQFELGGSIPLDPSVLLYTLGISIATGLLAGVLPAWRGSKTELNDALKQGAGRTSSDAGARRTRGALVAIEMAFSLILLIGAGLMVRTLWALTGVDPGFDPKNVLTLTASFSARQFPKELQAVRTTAFYDRVLQQVQAIPGVESAGLIDNLPLKGGSVQPFVIEGRPAALFAQQPTVRVRTISPGYVRAMRIPLLSGRDVESSDTAERPRVVLISESMAKHFWPGEDPIGKHLTLSFTPDIQRTVVGIVGDVKQAGLDIRESASTLYQVESQEALAPLSLAVRATGRPEALISAVTGTVQQLNPEQPLRDVRTMQDIVNESISDRRMSMFLLAAFAGLALLLAAFGMYSVLAYAVRRRVREIGIRMALGASVIDVLRIVAMETFWPAAAGIAIGLAGSWTLSGLLTSLVYGIRPGDPLTFASVALILALVSILASILPAWRAARIDPLQALREE